MGWNEEASPYHEVYINFKRQKPKMIPLVTSLKSLLILNDNSIDVPEMLPVNYSVLWKKASTLERNIKNYKKSGYNLLEIVELFPAVVNISPERVKKVEALIGMLHADPKAIIAQHISLLGLKDAGIARSMRDPRGVARRKR